MFQLLGSNELVVVDVSETAFIDSSFIRALVRAQKYAATVGSRLRLQVGTEPVVRKVLEMTGVMEYLDCVSTRAEALSLVTDAPSPVTEQ